MPSVSNITSCILLDSSSEVPPGFAAWVKLANTIKSDILLQVDGLLQENNLARAVEIYEDLYGLESEITWH